MRVTVNRPFHDIVEGVERLAGESFDATPARAAQLLKRLPYGYVTVTEEVEEAPEPPAEAPDYASMTVAQLRELCAERGIDAPKKARKVDLMALLEG